jgi:hypothetical protein
MRTTIPVTRETRELLKMLGRKDESYDQVIRRLVRAALEAETPDMTLWRVLVARGRVVFRGRKFLQESEQRKREAGIPEKEVPWDELLGAESDPFPLLC